MMHNSLFIRDRLAAANTSGIQRLTRDPHRSVIPWQKNDGSEGEGEGAGELQAEGMLKLSGSWAVLAASPAAAATPGVVEACEDIAAFLRKLGLAAAVGEAVEADDAEAPETPVAVPNTAPNAALNAASGYIRLRIDSSVAEGEYVRCVQPGEIILSASSMQGMWAAAVGLERELANRGTPFLKLGEEQHRPAWKVQISQAPFGSNYLVPDLCEPYLSESAFRKLAHWGINGMTIYGDWLCYVQSERYSELNAVDYEKNIALLRQAAASAAKYGIRLYYVAVSPKLRSDHPLFQRLPDVRGARLARPAEPGESAERKPDLHNLCSTSPASLELHQEVFGNLFREVPQLGGLNLIIGGESYYHCYMRPDLAGLPPGRKTNCACCSSYTAEEAVNMLLAATAQAVHAVEPAAPVLAWPYSAFIWSSDPAQLALLEGMSPEVDLLTTIDKDQLAQKEGYRKLIWDYSVDYAGPADHVRLQREVLERKAAAQKAGAPGAEPYSKLYIKTETALGLELIQFPYIPCLPRLHRKWRNVAEQAPAGVLQSWMFFGMWGSRAEELGWWANWHPGKTEDEVLEVMARRDFREHAGAIRNAWTAVDRAVSHLPCVPNYFSGPEFIGPAHPIYWEPPVQPDDRFRALLYYLQEHEETFSTAVKEVWHSLIMDQLPHAFLSGVIQPDSEASSTEIAIDEYRLAWQAALEAYEHLRGLAATEATAQQVLEEEQTVVEMFYRTLETVYHTYRFLQLQEARLHGAATEADEQEMRAIFRREAANTRAAIPIYERAPWLDLGLRVDGHYPSSLAMARAKLAYMEAELG